MSEGETRTVDGTDFKNISKAITDSKPGDTIFLGGKTYVGNNSQIIVNKANLTIIGGSSLDDDSYATLDAQFTSRIMQVSASNVIIKNIKFINGNITGNNGGGINWNAVNGTVDNCIFEDNSAGDQGGALYLTRFSSNFCLNNSIFNNNKAGSNGGALSSYGNNVSVKKSNFTNNSGNYGGAIQMCRYSDSIDFITTYYGDNGRIIDCNFINNNGGAAGGAIRWVGVNGTLTNSYFYNNTANQYAGAVAWNSAARNAIVSYCKFINNTVIANDGGGVSTDAPNFQLFDCEFIDNSAGSLGGGIRLIGINSTVSNCNFTNNYAKTGGAFYSLGSNGTLTNSNFYNNTAYQWAGAVAWNNAANNAIVSYCKFINNTAATSGGALSTDASNSKIFDCEFIDNYAKVNGGAFRSIGVNATVINCNFTNNTAMGNGGAFILTGANGTLTMSTFNDNIAAGSGGAVRWEGANGTFADCSFTNNVAGSEGGAFLLDAANCKITDCDFINNTVTDNYGGAMRIWSNGVNTTVSDCIFINSTAGSDGGSINSNGANSTFTNIHIENSYSGRNGGAVVMHNAANTIMDNITFINNNAAGNGGAISWSGDNGVNGTVTNSKFINNNATSAGAVIWNSFNGTLNNSEFIDNTARDYGALTWNGDNGTVSDSKFRNNNATWGGAVQWSGVNGNLTNSEFINNTAVRGGGAINDDGDNFYMGNCNFTNNSATSGGAFRSWAVNTTVGNCNFINNNGTEGGALRLLKDNATIIDCNFIGNNASEDGGAIRIDGNNGIITKSDFTNNSAKLGGAIHATGDGTKIDGNTFKDNKAVYGGSDFWIDGPNNQVINNNVDNANSNVTSMYVTDSANLTESGNTFTDDNKKRHNAQIIIEVDPSFIGHINKQVNVPVYIHDDLGIPMSGEVTIFGYGAQLLVDGRATFTIPMPAFQTTLYLSVLYDREMKNTIIEVVDTNAPIEEIIQPDNGKDEVVLHFPKDATGNVTVTINGKNYTSNVVDGFAVVEIDDLPNGNYPATVHYSGDGNYSQMTQSMNVNVKNSKVNPVTKILSNSDVSAVYSGKATYKFLVTKDGRIVGAGESVTINFNGKNSIVKTDANGYVNFNVDTNVKPGTYTIKATYYGSTVTNKVKVSQIIKASNKKVKKSAKVTKVKVSLAKVNGKFLAKKVLKIKFNKKTYKVKTNKKGVAIWKVKKSMLKKLKVGKKVKYTVTYGKATLTKKLTIKK